MSGKAAKLITIVLFIYSLFFSLSLFFGALSKGFSPGNLATIIIFLPVVYYFIREIFWQIGSSTHGFNFGTFLSHQGFSFYLTLLLLFGASILIFFKNIGALL